VTGVQTCALPICNIVNASSTGGNIDADLVSIMVEKTNYAANVEVIKTVGKMNKALLDIKV
jgi:flagellar hook protein FlgE